MYPDGFLNRFPLSKEEDELCGTACLSVIHACLGLNVPLNCSGGEIWTAQLACFLRDCGVGVQLFCSPGSRLYHDYLLADAKLREEWDCFHWLAAYEAAGDKPLLLDLTVGQLDQHLGSGVVLALVDSAVWNDDRTMNGGHFCVLLDKCGQTYLAANPGRTQIHLLHVPQEQFMRAFTKSGGWGFYTLT